MKLKYVVAHLGHSNKTRQTGSLIKNSNFFSPFGGWKSAVRGPAWPGESPLSGHGLLAVASLGREDWGALWRLITLGVRRSTYELGGGDTQTFKTQHDTFRLCFN